MRPTLGLAALAAAGVAACQPVGVPSPVALNRHWMFGVETMRGDAGPQLPYTNRFIADLSAMPNVQIVYAGNERNNYLFSAWTGSRECARP